MYELNSRIEGSEERTSVLKGRTIEVSKFEQQRGKNRLKKEREREKKGKRPQESEGL